MPLIAFVRHGEADNNVKRLLVGRHIESHLTERGIQQVKDTGQHLKKLKIDRVYVSPVTRAIETAKIICEINDLQYQTDERLYEIELGDLVGMNYDDVIEKHGHLFLEFYSGDGTLLDSCGIDSFSTS
ncbi:MAG: histidine phosphatase family protein, partial [Nitrosopumilales archaeon]